MAKRAARCSVKGCGGPVKAKGLCNMHDLRKRQWKNPGPAEKIGRWAPVEVRFWNHVQINGPIPRRRPQLGACHIWTGVIHRRTGYGSLGVDGRKVYAHRFAWKLARGVMPPGRLTHLCGNRRCVRVDHLKIIG